MIEPFKTIYKHLGTLIFEHATGQYSDVAFHMFLQETYCPILGFITSDPLTIMPLCRNDPVYN